MPDGVADYVPPALFPYRVRPGQESVLRAVFEVAERGGALLCDAPTGSGKTVAALAPLLEHAVRADHKILYLVRTHAQEVQVLNEARAISHRLDGPLLSIGLEGRAGRCPLLEQEAEIHGSTAEEHGKLCADRKRATAAAFESGRPPAAPDLPPGDRPVDLFDLDGCAYYARVLQADLEPIAERLVERHPTPGEFDAWARSENLCPYELAKKLAPAARLVTAPYAFFFHPRVRPALFTWLGVGAERLDVVIDEAHNLPDYLRDSTTVSLPEGSVRRAITELEERGDFQLPEGPSASRLLALVQATIAELVQEFVHGEDAILPANMFEDLLLTSVGGTTHRYDTWLGALAAWGENLREERRRERRLPRSWVHSVALTLLSWPRLEPPTYVKVAVGPPHPGLEAYALDVRAAAEPLLACHATVHLSGTLSPIDAYQDALGLRERSRAVVAPSSFPPSNVKYLYDPDLTTRFEEVRNDPRSVPRIADRLAYVLGCLPVKTAVFFPSFDWMQRILDAGLESAHRAHYLRESPELSTADLWRSIEAHKHEGPPGVILGVAGGRIAEGLDFPGSELEAVVVVGIPYPRPSARREALRLFLDNQGGRGWADAYEAPARRAIRQAIGRMIRSEHDRGIAVLLDHRAARFQDLFPGLAPIGDLRATARAFYGHRARWSEPSAASGGAAPGPGEPARPP